MFGLSTKEIITKEILKASKNNKDILKQGIKNNKVAFENGDEETAKIFSMIRKTYFDAVSNDVYNSIQSSTPKIAANIFYMFMYPEKCGYDDMNIDDGLSASKLYAIVYYAFKGKVAPIKDCIELNHLQNNIMNEVFDELEITL